MGRDGTHLPLYSSGYGSGPPRRKGSGGPYCTLSGIVAVILVASTLGMVYALVTYHGEASHLKIALDNRDNRVKELGEQPPSPPLLAYSSVPLLDPANAKRSTSPPSPSIPAAEASSQRLKQQFDKQQSDLMKTMDKKDQQVLLLPSQQLLSPLVTPPPPSRLGCMARW